MVTPKSAAASRPLFSKRRIIILLLLLAALYAVVPQLGSFHDSLKLWETIQWPWTFAALIIFSTSYFLAAGVYMALSLRPLRYTRTVLVQLAAMFAGRLLPAGVGALGVDYRYLRQVGHSRTQAGTIVGLNNTLGLVGHIMFLLVLAAGGGLRHQHLHISEPKYLVFLIVAILIVACGALLITSVRDKLRRLLRQSITVLVGYRHRPGHIIVALLASLLLTTMYVLTLYSCAHALGMHLSLFAMFIVLTIGVIGATATPTPGGLGGAEAGIVGGLVLAGLSTNDGLAVALLYRLVTFWLPLAIGGAAFFVAQRREYI